MVPPPPISIIIIGYCINTTCYGRGHVSDALPSLRGYALPRHERGHKMLYLYNNLIIIYPYTINRNHADHPFQLTGTGVQFDNHTNFYFTNAF